MIAAPDISKETRFDWPLCQEAEDAVLGVLRACSEKSPFLATLEQRMRDETGTLLIDWVDHLVVPESDVREFRHAGYTLDRLGDTPEGTPALWHPEAMLPRVLLADRGEPVTVAIRAESIADFLAAHGISSNLHGSPLTRYRTAVVSEENDVRLLVVERRGYRGYVPATLVPGQAATTLIAHETWRTRPRNFDDDAIGWSRTQTWLNRVIALAGRDIACAAIFTEERTFWQGRNRAAQIQKVRQDRLGLGWANHDHHTFRSSREHFVQLMQALEKLGFERRERYYAGAQAGWGAQILEQPVEGLVAFCDVDLEPEETEIDFSRVPLPRSAKLGTIGLWVGLHGESFLQAGMHHLECRFDHALLKDQLEREGVQTMKPFSDLPFLKQAFTEGERWKVRPERAQKLLNEGLITQQQYDTFVRDGAIGSHLENLQRKGGFKGFNQKSVSAIIAAVDPRMQLVH
ncbi:hypothetical protein DES53_10330 [Roseimicrobium gellanilyticum]|uniref:Uncharacterized protein n=2 Tax=Roseimicrobium gellanilyticum TaxID=748857 RepID=A0A366HNG6_9BACT|nr:hypothetical protein DES53_10330 [Roseimicrobium gellanilyticum]